MDKLKFKEACEKIISDERKINGIGTLSEKTLHAVLKQYFEPYEDNHETKLGSFVADIFGQNEIIEIQTRAFNTLRKKLDAFLSVCPVTVVYPVADTKWLLWINEETGEITNKRKSPRRGKVYDIFDELYKIKNILTNPNLKLCIVLLEMEEYRYLNGWSKDKKKGSSRCERIPTELIDEIYIENITDYQKLIPETLQKSFSAKDFKKETGLSIHSAQTALNVLNYIEAVKRTGKKGHAYLYERNF